MIGVYNGSYGKIKLGFKNPGQAIAAALDPIGYLAQGSKAGETFSKITRPHHYLLFRQTGQTHTQQVRAVQQQAHQRLANEARKAPSVGDQQGQMRTNQPPSSPPTMALVGVAAFAGALLLGAAYFRKRSR